MSEAISPIAALSADELAPPMSLWQLAWRRFRLHTMAVVGGIVLCLLVIYCFGGALFFTEKYSNFNDLDLRLMSPSMAHPF